MIHIILLDETRALCGQAFIHLYFPPDITFSQMMKAIYFKFDRDERDLTLINYSQENPNRKIHEIFIMKEQSIYISNNSGVLGGIFNVYGKRINLLFNGNNITIGILNSNKKLMKEIESQEGKKVKKIYIEGKELNMDGEKSLLSLGIKEDCSINIKNKVMNKLSKYITSK
jgi:hypothetical protein